MTESTTRFAPGDAESLGSDPESATKGYRGVAMEGAIARWYDRTRGTPTQVAAWQRQAVETVASLPAGAQVLEVAPGPGYFSVELARTGRARVTALEISRTFVEIAQRRAALAGVGLDVRQGDAARMPFPDNSFDLVVCQAAFKNFSRPQAAVNEMYRVLRPGRSASIEDMRRDAPDELIRQEVDAMGLRPLRAYFTRRALVSLRRRAYTKEQFALLARRSPFGECVIKVDGIGLEVRLFKPASGPSLGSERLQ
ncbi:MAG TPA: class I SAM-dependent methyltransferase [Thermoplasmata archaeon]|nr:class I SAM-dependent methyltransferase [Thermoplasmata archaeon]